MTDGTSDSGHVGEALVPFLDDQMSTERARKSSLEARGIAVVSTSGALVTLLLGVVAAARGPQGFAVALPVRAVLVAAMALFIAASLLGIYVNAPSGYFDVDPGGLRVLATPANWIRPGDEARRQLTAARVETLVKARSRNQVKARVLLLAVGAEAVGVGLAATATAIVLL